MTEENYKYRTSPFLLRNQFGGTGRWKIPVIPKAEFREEEFDGLLLLGFDRANLEDDHHLDRMVHFFLYDYKFERVWKSPDSDIEKLKRYRAVLSPDFSMYLEMSPSMQLYNVFRNRWCGAYFAGKGIRVIPTVSWGDAGTFDFCFEGIPKGSTVAVSTFMVSAHGNHADQKEFFLKGYRELLRRVEPERVICYNKPFPEMEGNIVYVDYELSSWKYQSNDFEGDVPSQYLPYILGEKLLPENSLVKIKQGCVLGDETGFKGMGSAFGGDWRPKKSDDERFLGEPGEIKRTWRSGKKGGYLIETKIGDNGKAIRERQYTDHFRPDKHTDPHDHIVDWSDGFPNPNRYINYPSTDYPDGAPEFKHYGEVKQMSERTWEEILEDNRFKTISDFKWCVKRGGEIQFDWNGKSFAVFPFMEKTPDSPPQIMICQVLIDNPEETEGWYDTPDEALEYMIDGERLRDIITKVDVNDRTI